MSTGSPPDSSAIGILIRPSWGILRSATFTPAISLRRASREACRLLVMSWRSWQTPSIR